MYEEMQSVLNVRRTNDGNGTYGEIDTVVLFLKNIVSGVFENADNCPKKNMDNYRNYKKQLEERGIYTVQFLLENPDVLYGEIAPHFEFVEKTLERDVFDEYYSGLVDDANRLRQDVNRTWSVNGLLHMDSIPDKGNVVFQYNPNDDSNSNRALEWMRRHNNWFGPLTLPEEEES